jgi:hypothetical protein
MNAATNTEITAVQTAPAPVIRRTTAMELMSDHAAMDRMMRLAEIMASGITTTPKHLQKNVGDCFAVVIQATVWGMLPHIVAQKTHLVNGTLGYEAQLVNAVVQESGAITGRFHYEYEGKSPNLMCRVGAVLRGETEITWGHWLGEKDVTTKNSPLWKTNPPQQLGYLQVKNWARLYAPGAILGVYTPDEIETFAPPRHMGSAEVLDTRPELDADALIKEGWAKAEKGMAEFGPWFNGLPKLSESKHRDVIRPHRDEMLAKAKKVDDARTVDQPTKQAAAAADTGEVTADQVLAKINAATNEDALYVAADWINAITDNAEVAKLNARFDERLAELRV